MGRDLKISGKLVLIMLLVLLLIGITSCQQTISTSSSVSTTTTKGSTSETTGSEPTDEPMTLVWLGYSESADVEQDLLEPYVEELFNVDIVRVSIPFGERERFPLYFAEGNRPDVLMVRHISREKLIEEGFIRSFDIEDYYSHMPDYSSNLSTIIDKDEVEKQMLINGLAWGIPYTSEGYIAPFASWYNTTWLDKAGMTSIPTTLDEMYQYCHFVTFNDPDGNGTDDTWGLSSAGTGMPFLSIFASFGSMYNSYILEDDGSVTATSVSNNYKEALKLLAKWYADGVIDPEFATRDWPGYQNLCFTSTIGLYEHRVTSYSGDLNNFASFSPDYTFDCVTGLKNSEGIMTTWRDFPSLYSIYPFYFGINCSDEQMYKGMEILNHVCSSKEAAAIFKNGANPYTGEIGEGKSYSFDEYGTYSNPWRTPDSTAYDWTVGGYYFYGIVPSMISPVNTLHPDAAAKVESALSLPFVYRGNAFPFASASTVYANKSTDVSTVTGGYLADAIMGRKDIDATWDAYVSEWTAAGGQSIVEDFEKLAAQN